jgi:hypothetical protein
MCLRKVTVQSKVVKSAGREMAPTRNVADVLAQYFAASDRLPAPMLQAFALNTRSQHATINVLCFQCVY